MKIIKHALSFIVFLTLIFLLFIGFTSCSGIAVWYSDFLKPLGVLGEFLELVTIVLFTVPFMFVLLGTIGIWMYISSLIHGLTFDEFLDKIENDAKY